MTAKEFAEKYGGQITIFKSMPNHGSGPPSPLNICHPHRVLIIGCSNKFNYVVGTFIDNPEHPGWEIKEKITITAPGEHKYGWYCFVGDLAIPSEAVTEKNDPNKFKLLQVD